MGNSGVNEVPFNDTDKIIEIICRESQLLAIDFRNEYKSVYDIDLNPFMPNYSTDWLKQKCASLKLDYEYMTRSLGTLGGGNHFVELNQSENKELYLTIHCGSRCLGSAICHYHQEKINETRYIDWASYEKDVERMKRHTKVPKELKNYADNLRQELIEAKHTDYLELEEAYEYFFDMIFAQEFAKWNRRTIIKEVLTKLNINFDSDLVIESVHNYVDFNDMIIRKGAISAHADKLCIVALNQRDGILLLQSKYENDEWNYSAPHGCGRRLTREQAKSQLKLSEVKEQMKDVYSTTVVEETIEESPDAYKDPNLILEIIRPYFNIKNILKPLINVKGIN
jgi:RNA-splicing ligase RtcB